MRVNGTMNFKHNLLLAQRSHHVVRSVWDMSSQWGPGSAFPTSRGWLRRFLLLKLLTVLLLPHRAGLPLLVGCVFSLRALLLLGSPRISTKPCTVLLAQLALTDGLVLLHWVLRLGATLARWGVEEESSAWWRDSVSTLCQQLLDAHYLASLLLLGLLGLEAMMVSRWPQQTRRFRTSHFAQLSCRLVWIFVLLELVSLLHVKLLQDFRQQTYLPALPALSVWMRRMLWLMDSWLHYTIFIRKPLRRKSSFH